MKMAVLHLKNRLQPRANQHRTHSNVNWVFIL